MLPRHIIEKVSPHTPILIVNLFLSSQLAEGARKIGAPEPTSAPTSMQPGRFRAGKVMFLTDRF
jgi:hypothetical protein